ncbi:MAG: hypothetical protein ACOX7I_01955 [Oscillospiraceae bacterium]|jgi:hypothetical protein
MDNGMKKERKTRPAPPPGQEAGVPPFRVPPVELPPVDFDSLTLDWGQYAGKWKKSEDSSYYELKFVYYCSKVVSPEHQYINIFVPSPYLNEDGSVNTKNRIGPYTGRTAPIVLHNNCGGWRSSIPLNVKTEITGQGLAYLKEGFVYISVGARSRGLKEGIGKAPAPVVDQKAAVRFLRLHDDKIPGCKDRIFSTGGSGGGQMSSALGATGNMPVFYPELYKIGAAGIEKTADGGYISTIPDDILGSNCYCPIADIENADAAFAWQFYDSGFAEADEFGARKKLSPFMLALQDDLARAYCRYIADLNLKSPSGEPLAFDRNADGSWNPRSGSYYRQILNNLSECFNKFIAYHRADDGTFSFVRRIGFDGRIEKSYPSVEAFISDLPNAHEWLKRERDGSYSVTDIAGMLRSTGAFRGKVCPAFDSLWYVGENDAFGCPEEDAVHFSRINARVMKENLPRYSRLEGFEDADVTCYIEEAQREDIARQAYLMNATRIMLNKAAGREKTDISPFWRIRSGTHDQFCSYPVTYNLAVAASMAGAQVDYSLIWFGNHGDLDGEGTGTICQWIHKVCQKS